MINNNTKNDIEDRDMDVDSAQREGLVKKPVKKPIKKSSKEEDDGKITYRSKLSKNQPIDPTQIYLREIGFTPLLTPEEEVTFGRLARKGDGPARKRMIESNLRLVVKIVRRYINRGMPFLDLIEEGNLGLMHAIEKFDPERGFRFSTYATWWIRQTIERAIMNQTRTIRLPVHVIKELNTYLRAAKELEKSQDHRATPEEIAELVDKPLGDVKKLLSYHDPVASIDSPLSLDSTKTLKDVVADEHHLDPEEILGDDNLQTNLEGWLQELDERHREVIMRRFGLGKYDEKATLEEVGDAIGLTRERVRQIQVEGLNQLRDILERHDLSADSLFGEDGL
jgi:RNA polymerase nonessential primary-like sigma factor